MADNEIEAMDHPRKKTKLVTESNVTMTDCLNALKKLRNCPVCPLRNDREACKAKRCVPRVVVDRIELAIRQFFYQQKFLIKTNPEGGPAADSTSLSGAESTSAVDKLRI